MIKSTVNKELLRELLGEEIQVLIEKQETDEQKKNIENFIENLTTLRAAYASFKEEHVFSPGQIVTWKPRMRNRQIPFEEQLAIVIDVLDEPIFENSNDSSSSYYREPLDLILGVMGEDNDLLTFHYDRRRFKPFI